MLSYLVCRMNAILHTKVQSGQCCCGAEDVVPLPLCSYGRKSLTYAGGGEARCGVHVASFAYASASLYLFIHPKYKYKNHPHGYSCDGLLST